MGKVLVSILMCCFLALDVFAQAPAAAPADAAAPAKKTVSRGKAKKTAEAKAAEVTPAPAPAGGGQVAPPAVVTKDKKGHKAHTPGTATPGTDKLIGKDAKGHDVYQGPKGGQYYISNGNKQYLDKKEKLKV
jgi:PBCV-specific basic adaptor domain